MTKKKTLPLSQVYRYLEPAPVVLVSSARKGKANINEVILIKHLHRIYLSV